MKGCSNRRQFNEPFQRNPSHSIAIHRNVPCNPCNPHRNPSLIHRNPSQCSIAIHCIPSQSIAIHRNASVRDTTSYSYLSVSGRKKFQLPHLRGSQGGVLAVRGRRQLPSSRGQKGAPEAGRGRLNYLLPPQRGPSEISLRRSNYFQTCSSCCSRLLCSSLVLSRACVLSEVEIYKLLSDPPPLSSTP